ncbi:MAG: hypothetical protein KDA80_10870 [Planctomycetaceae bacterium]|nr:hypothetical protein [Planctomycetaceae bacterium]
MSEKGIVTPIAYSRTLLHVAAYAMLVGLYAVLPTLKEYSRYQAIADLPAEIHAALTLVLGWLLVFRTNTAYARWWEARTLWGALVNACRNLAVKINILVHAEDEFRERSRELIVQFPPVLKDHLRDGVDTSRYAVFDGDRPVHAPSEIVRQLYGIVRRWKHSGQIDGEELRTIDEELRRFLDICGGCERIRKTRIARSYRIFARQCVFLFLATFPWGISNDFGVWTIPLTVIVAYFMIGLETVAEHVEEPFGLDEDDLDLEGLCQTIEASVNEIYTKADR